MKLNENNSNIKNADIIIANNKENEKNESENVKEVPYYSGIKEKELKLIYL